MKLTLPEQRWLVESFAMYGKPADVAKDFQEVFGKPIDRRQAWEYDLSPTRESNRERRTQELCDLFDRVRKKYLEETEDIRIASTAFRLRTLDTMLEDVLSGTQPARKTALLIMEQAAKERGGAYTNRREHTGKDGAPLPAAVAPTVVMDLSKLTDEQLDALESLHGRNPESGNDPAREGDP